MPISNASLLDENFSDISDWTNGDQAPATSTQETFDTEETLCQDTNGSAAGNDYCFIYRTVGSIEGLGNTITLSVKLNHDLIGTLANTDAFVLNIFRDDWAFKTAFASDGLYISDDGNPGLGEVGVNLVSLDTWQEWTFVIDLSGGIDNAVCDIYLKVAGEYVLQAADVGCSNVGVYELDGHVQLQQFGYTTDDQITYADYLKIGDGSSTVTVISDSVINIGDEHKNLVSGVINIGSNWKNLVAGYQNIGGVWKTIF